MSNSCFDPAEEHGACYDTLADPFRRRLLSAAVLTATGGALAVSGVPLPSLAANAGRASGSLFPFAALPVSTDDTVSLPAGFKASLLYAWGDPISDGPRGRADADDHGVVASEVFDLAVDKKKKKLNVFEHSRGTS